MKKNNIILLFVLCFVSIFALGAMNLTMIRTIPRGYYGSFNATTKANSTNPRVYFDLARDSARDFVFGHNGSVPYMAVRYQENVYNSSGSLTTAQDWVYMYANSTLGGTWIVTTNTAVGVTDGD